MILGVEINLAFTAIYFALGVPLILVQLYGAWRKEEDGSGGGDTISENWYWLGRMDGAEND
jgi:SH3-like domain-containing protein